MLCVLAHYPGDEEQCLRLANWIRELGPYQGHELLLIADMRSTKSAAIRSELDHAGFDKIEELVNRSIIDGWPHAACFVFSMASRHITASSNQPFLWLEPDVVPMAKGWLDELEKEYKSAGKLFMGDFVDVANVIPHMSGIGVYPGDLIEAGAGYALIAGDTAWDVMGAGQIVPKMHTTEKIVHNWRHEAFKNQGELDNLLAQHPQCLLFHSDKTGSIPPLLRERKYGESSQERQPTVHHDIHSTRSPYQAPNQEASIQKGMASAASREGQGNVLADAQKGQSRETSSGRRRTEAYLQGQDYQAESMQQVSEANPSKAALRSSHELSGTAESGMAVPEMPRAGTLAVQRDAGLNLEGGGQQHAVLGDTHPRPSFSCDIFVKSYPPDYPWLAYCLRSIDKFASGFRPHTIIVLPDTERDKFPPGMGMKNDPIVHYVGEQPDGYLWQMVIKLDADRYTDASHILYIDSDTIFTTPVSPKNYMANGKVVWMLTPYEKVTTPWQQVIEKFLKKPVAFEFMRRQPFLVPRWLLSELRAFCEREHGITLDSYVLGQPHRAFSEFNALGAFAYEYFRDEFVWVNTEETPPDQWPELTVMQSWSRGGLTEEIKATYDKILSGEDSPASRRIVVGDSEGGEVQGNGEDDALKPEETPPSTFDVPIRLSNNAAKWDRVEQLVLELKGYCDNPSSTSRVRKALIGGGIFPDIILSWLKQGKRKRKRVSSK